MIPLQLGQCAAMVSVDTRGKSQTNRPERLHAGWLQFQLRMFIFVANGTVGNGYDLLTKYRPAENLAPPILLKSSVQLHGTMTREIF